RPTGLRSRRRCPCSQEPDGPEGSGTGPQHAHAPPPRPRSSHRACWRRAFPAAAAAGTGGTVADVSEGPGATLLARTEALLRARALVVADLADAPQLCALAAHRSPGELLIAVQRVEQGPGGQLLWLGAAGLPGTAGSPEELTSPTTQQRGLVS